MCRWCRFGSARKSMQPHHPHREMRTRGRVPLVLMAHRPHWKTQPYRTRNRGSRAGCVFQRSAGTSSLRVTGRESIQMNGLSCTCKMQPRAAA
ncbi:unnamed protein product [Staurois parvus]|uniref:Uncharacterized protein n=1 Tax=Staurois parvus TaxID=386267 RepID=A0ABN9BTY2_9NEOB|nr:unnamed protein product [Staurois parvus]